MKDFDFYNKKYSTLLDLKKMSDTFRRKVSNIAKKQEGSLDSNDIKALDKQIGDLRGPYIIDKEVYERFFNDGLIEPLKFKTIIDNLYKKNDSLMQKNIKDSGQGTLFEQEERLYCQITPAGKKKIKEIEAERRKRESGKQLGLFGENKMKISKERLMEIIKEECDMAMLPQSDYQMTPDGEIDREGRMAKRQLADIAEYAQELTQMLGDETQLEAWVQAKLTKAADYIKTVKHYVEYGMEEGAYDQVVPQMAADMTPPMDDIEEFEYDEAEFNKYDKEY